LRMVPVLSIVTYLEMAVWTAMIMNAPDVQTRIYSIMAFVLSIVLTDMEVIV